MAVSKGREILEALQKQLKKISVLNGYKTDVNLVTFTLKTGDEVNHDAIICIWPQEVPLTPLTNQGYTSGDSRQTLDGWTIRLLLYKKIHFEDSEEGGAFLGLEDMIADIINNLTQQSHLGLGLDYVHSVTLDLIARAPNVEETIAMAQIWISIKYDFDYGEA